MDYVYSQAVVLELRVDGFLEEMTKILAKLHFSAFPSSFCDRGLRGRFVEFHCFTFKELYYETEKRVSLDESIKFSKQFHLYFPKISKTKEFLLQTVVVSKVKNLVGRASIEASSAKKSFLETRLFIALFGSNGYLHPSTVAILKDWKISKAREDRVLENIHIELDFFTEQDQDYPGAAKLAAENLLPEDYVVGKENISEWSAFVKQNAEVFKLNGSELVGGIIANLSFGRFLKQAESFMVEASRNLRLDRDSFKQRSKEQGGGGLWDTFGMKSTARVREKLFFFSRGDGLQAAFEEDDLSFQNATYFFQANLTLLYMLGSCLVILVYIFMMFLVQYWKMRVSTTIFLKKSESIF